MSQSIIQKINAVFVSLEDLNMDDILMCVENNIDENTDSIKKEDVQNMIEQDFISECNLFLKENQKFHNFCVKIANRADQIAAQIEKVQKYLQIKASTELELNVRRLLEKSHINQQRQKILSIICDYIIIPQDLLDCITLPNVKISTKFFEAAQAVEKQMPLLFTLQTYGEKNFVQSFRKNYVSLKNMITSKLISQLKHIKEYDMSLMRSYKSLLWDNQENKSKFKDAIISYRIEQIKNHFIPELNKLNYSLNKQLFQYYKEILPEIVHRFQIEKEFLEELFAEDQYSKSQILTKLLNSFLPEIYSKLERSFYKTTDFCIFAKIKHQYYVHQQQFLKLFTPDFKVPYVCASIAKLSACIQSSLATEAQRLINAKYNIYSISSYMTLSQHLQSVYEAYSTDRLHSEETSEIWLSAFYKFSSSRMYNQKNKSLVIFNLNMWEIYKNIWWDQNIVYDKEKLNERYAKVMAECKKIFFQMNLIEIETKLIAKFESPNKKQAISLLLDIYSKDFKKIIFAEIELVVHLTIRNQLKSQLNKYFLQIYQRLLALTGPQSNAQLKKLCGDESINIKRLGKSADTVEILDMEQMRRYLQC